MCSEPLTDNLICVDMSLAPVPWIYRKDKLETGWKLEGVVLSGPVFEHCSRKRMKHGTKRKTSRFLDFDKNAKNVKNVEVITYRSIELKSTVTTLNQFCCPSRNYQAHICGAYFNQQ